MAVLALLAATLLAQAPATTPRRAVAETIDVAPVWSGHPVGFALLTHGRQQFVAYYDAQRQMTVASRRLDSPEWSYVRLSSKVAWDSHNYITMAVDSTGHLHLSGNMHCVPLVYFRSERPLDAHSLARVAAMTGRDESSCTYPRFLFDAAGRLLFTYRDGRSGQGNQIWNVYDVKRRAWQRLLDQPLFDGQGEMNAYFHGPLRDAQGVYHIAWVWRDTPDCATNHDLCYARSPDLVHWEKSDGTPLALPITLASAEVVDPVPAGGGIINGGCHIGFDAQGRPVLSYHKYDTQGITQAYNARRGESGWQIVQASQWSYRWAFQGGGSIDSEVGVSPIAVEPDGQLTQAFSHRRHGSGRWRLDPLTLKPLGMAPRPAKLSPEIGPLASTWPGMKAKTASDIGSSGEPGVEYLLRWETLGPNRDRPRAGTLPPATMLRLIKIASSDG